MYWLWLKEQPWRRIQENLTSESQLGGYTTCLGLRPVGGFAPLEMPNHDERTPKIIIPLSGMMKWPDIKVRPAYHSTSYLTQSGSTPALSSSARRQPSRYSRGCSFHLSSVGSNISVCQILRPRFLTTQMTETTVCINYFGDQDVTGIGVLVF